MRRGGLLALALGALVVALAAPAAAVAATATTAPSARTTTGPVVVKVVGNRLVNGAGDTVRLLGVNRSGTEYACVEGWGIFDGPSTARSVAAMASWHVNVVRVPLNEACWLGLHGVSASYGGRAYRNAIVAYVKLLHRYDLAAILSLQASEQLSPPPRMADAAHSPAFWRSVATTFKADHGVIFDLYNEPNGLSWPCWAHGCTLSGGFKTAGMQSLVDAVRSTGATQPLMLGGLDYSSDETKWAAYLPTDPDHELIVSFHTYNTTNCDTTACWDATIAPLARKVPVVTGENGEYDCHRGYVDKYMAWADAHGVSYLGWAWDATSSGGWTCAGGPSLISTYDGAPTAYGLGLKDHLAALDRAGKLPPPLDLPAR